jgi:MFS family permease
VLAGSSVHPPAALAWLVWGLGASLYAIAFFQRVAPAVMTDELMSELSLSAVGLGHLSAFYFYAYVAMQVPTGLAADRFGARRVLAVGAAIATGGALLFALAPGFAGAALGRTLIGASVGVAFVATLKLAAHWIPPQQFALASGLTLAFGMSGAVLAGLPLRAGVSAFGWRPVMLASALITALVLVAILALVRDDPAHKGYASHFGAASAKADGHSVWRGLGEVLRYRNVRLLFFAPEGVAGATIAFGGLWGVPFLGAAYGLSRELAALVCSAMMIAWAIGGPLLGTISDRMARRKSPYLAGSLAALLVWSLVILVPGLPLGVLVTLLVVCGALAGAMIIGFAFTKESVPAHLAGTASGVVNMGAMVGPMAMQPLIGWLLDLNWRGELENGVRLYDAAAYRSAFSIMLLWLAFSVLAIAFTRDTRGRQSA